MPSLYSRNYQEMIIFHPDIYYINLINLIINILKNVTIHKLRTTVIKFYKKKK